MCILHHPIVDKSDDNQKNHDENFFYKTRTFSKSNTTKITSHETPYTWKETQKQQTKPREEINEPNHHKKYGKINCKNIFSLSTRRLWCFSVIDR